MSSGLVTGTGPTVIVARSFDFGPDFEPLVLSCVLLDAQFLGKFRPVIDPDMFAIVESRFLVQTTLDLYDKFKTAPSRDVIADMVRRSDFRNRTEAIELLNKLTPVTDTAYVAERVVEWTRWTGIQRVIDIHPRSDPRAFAVAVDRASRIGDELFSDHESLADENIDLSRIRNQVTPTPWTWLNTRLDGGPEKQDFCVAMSFVNVGKTTALINVAGSALAEGQRVLYLTFEDGPSKIRRRFYQFVNNMTKEQVFANLNQATQTTRDWLKSTGGELIIKRLRSRRSTVDDAIALVRMLNEDGERPIDTVCTDYMARFASSNMKSDPRHRLREIAEDCKYLATDLNVVHWSAAQVQRGRSGKEQVGIDHIGESLGLVEGCDIAIGLGQNKQDEMTNKINLYTAKVRDGRKHELTSLRYDAERQRIEDWK